MIAHRNIVKDIGRIFFWYPLRWCVLLMPISVVYRIGGILGTVDYFVSGTGRRQRMMKNLSVVCAGTEKQIAKILTDNLKNHCRTVLEFIKYPQINSVNLDPVVSFQGLEYLDRALEQGSGVLLATSHFGAKQMLQVGLGTRGYRVNQINYHMSSDELTCIQKNVSQRKRMRIEERIHANFIPAGGFMRSAFKCLKKNELLIIAADGSGLRNRMDRSFAPFDFFGKRMLFPTNPVSLAMRTGAAMVPVFVVREGSRHKIIIEPSIPLEGVSKEEGVKAYIAVLEKYVRRYPALWEFWEEFDEDNLLGEAVQEAVL